MDAQVFPPQWIPNPIITDAYVDVWKVAPLLSGMGNSLIIAVPVLFFGTLCSAMAAFCLCQDGYTETESFVHGAAQLYDDSRVVTMIPQYVVWGRLNLQDTFIPLIVPGMLGNVTMMFFFRQYLSGVPNELVDAGKIDGAGWMTIFTRLILPTMRPAIAAQVIFWFMGIWNDFLGPLIYLDSEEKVYGSIGAATVKQYVGGYKRVSHNHGGCGNLLPSSLVAVCGIPAVLCRFNAHIGSKRIRGGRYMKYRTFIIGLALVLCVTLTACGRGAPAGGLYTERRMKIHSLWKQGIRSRRLLWTECWMRRSGRICKLFPLGDEAATTVKSFYGENGIYIGAEVKDNEPWGTSSNVYDNSSFEVYIDCNPQGEDKPEADQIEIFIDVNEQSMVRRGNGGVWEETSLIKKLML